uniref:Reverse transcriptase domain-containing protein n=1 Tax=Tanacetum cinerariifolium TaxID=118510 RepID=A0A6L2NXK8_TANCI|nr:reverse transcriptase domain-containing protein [Tanacetum cinerariifolium]
MARMDAIAKKTDTQYKYFQSRSKPDPDHNDDDIPMSREEDVKFMQTFCRARFNNDYRDRSEILHSIQGTILEEKLFAEFDEVMAMPANKNSESESDTEEPPFEKITINTDYKIKTSLKEPPMNLKLKPFLDNMEYKGGITVVTDERNELVPTRTVTCWRVCIDYRRLNEATTKDHLLLPFMDQMLERLTGNKYFCFPDGFSRYFQIPIDPMDQEKTTFTCPFGIYAYRRMPFGLCNAPATFQRCMLAIFHDMIEESVKVFMDDFSIFESSFDHFLNNLDKILQHCKDAHLVLNWEKCDFMVKERIMLGHKVSEAGLEVNKAKIKVISKLPPPLTSKLLEKDTSFEFDDKCHNAFKLLKEKLICAPVIVSPNWSLSFELMCDASDFAIGAILGQKDGRNFHPIYFASKTLNTAQQNYTITEKELMVVAFAFDKF